MKIELYEKVLLKTGETASVVEIYEQGVAYEMDIDKADGEIETETVYHDQIAAHYKKY